MHTGNPAFSKKTWKDTITINQGAHMTYNGTAAKTGLLFVLLLVAASYVWGLFMSAGQMTPTVSGFFWGGLIGGLILALITIFAKTYAMYTAPLYAVAEGFLLGGLSAMLEVAYPGIVMQAVMATLGVFVLMLVLYKARILKATPKFTKAIVFAIGGVLVTYIVGFIVSLFGVDFAIFGSGPIGILFSVVVAGIAAFSLILDFGMIEEGVKLKAPKYMEWYGGFALMVTLVWLYIEILRLLSKVRN